MKQTYSIILGIVIALFAGAVVAHAQYVPLAPLPIGDGGTLSTSYTINGYLSGMLKLIIALGGALSILMAIVGGTQYVASGVSPDAKNGAKERVQNALTGLALILTSYLILNSINPQLVQFNFMLPPVGVAPEQIVSPEIGPGPTAPSTASAGSWPSDAPERAQLPSGVTVNHSPGCANIGQQNCTSLAGMSQNVINNLIALKSACTGCGTIVITGGTEYWLHSVNTAHRPGGNVVDLSIGDSGLYNYITSHGTVVSAGCSVGTRYKIGSAIYVNEVIAGNSPHWHVCYY